MSGMMAGHGTDSRRDIHTARVSSLASTLRRSGEERRHNLFILCDIARREGMEFL
jgi:hypothetical protein